jgi:hypothetical protein
MFVFWRDDAACKDQPLDLFYPEDYDDPSAAFELCQRCPVQADCFAHAIKHERHGIWAHTTPLDRKKIRQKLGIRQESVTLKNPSE